MKGTAPLASDPPSPEPLQHAQHRPFRFHLDRTLGIPVGVQLRGQIEYGVACGEIERGSRLPSVRDLAQELGVAHMTVVQVYKELLALGLIVTQPGRGTFVAGAPKPGGIDLEPLRHLMTETLAKAAQAGYTQRQVSEVLNVLLSRGDRAARAGTGQVEVLLVGLFLDATSAYAQTLQDALTADDRSVGDRGSGSQGAGSRMPSSRVQAITLEELRHGQGVEQARRADVVLALAHRLLEVQKLLPGTEIVPVNFIPSEATRQALAALGPLTRLTVVATFEEFLPTFLAGVKRFAPLVSELRATHVHSAELQPLIDWCDVVVYATGSDLVAEVAGSTPSFEYRHTIDPRDIERLVIPAVNACHNEN
ncbi:GntR family transcriptional regulator (plasmid) [Deinococcus radiomollis]|uniref:GntR family transcriptional regulator n=1 Tax=Deinococcus radiomollis TaxID=468916 RepID=UPI003891AD2C